MHPEVFEEIFVYCVTIAHMQTKQETPGRKIDKKDIFFQTTKSTFERQCHLSKGTKGTFLKEKKSQWDDVTRWPKWLNGMLMVWRAGGNTLWWC